MNPLFAVARSRRGLASLLAIAVSLSPAAVRCQDSVIKSGDPRIGLKPGFTNAGEASLNLTLLAHRDKPPEFSNPSNIGDIETFNSDEAYKDNWLFQGNFSGFQIWDIKDPRNPVLRTKVVCPGGQGDVSVYGHLLFTSVEETRGRIDCGAQGVPDTVSHDRAQGVRIWDISNIDHPKQLTVVQTCRGSHTHTLMIDPKDKKNIYVIVSGTAGARSSNELKGCSRERPDTAALRRGDTTTSYFRIDIIRVPLAAPKTARVVSSPRVFADSAGDVAGLWMGGAHGAGSQTTSPTAQCHDVTVYSYLGLAAGACSGNGILLDIKDPVHPKRIDQVADPNFAFWHSATFSNDGKILLYTDEWGGGLAPRCRATDPYNWGADAIFNLGADRKLKLAGYYKMPAAQSELENCVAHNGGLIPVPGRNIMSQGWYQGGVSVFDFTDPAHAREIAFFDRGPIDSTKMVWGGYWAAYWYNGYLYGPELARGFDVFELKPSQYLSQNEIDAAKLVKYETYNPQNQPHIVWPANIAVPRAYVDQLERDHGLPDSTIAHIRAELDRGDAAKGAARRAVFRQLAMELCAAKPSEEIQARLSKGWVCLGAQGRTPAAAEKVEKELGAAVAALAK